MAINGRWSPGTQSACHHPLGIQRSLDHKEIAIWSLMQMEWWPCPKICGYVDSVHIYYIYTQIVINVYNPTSSNLTMHMSAIYLPHWLVPESPHSLLQRGSLWARCSNHPEPGWPLIGSMPNCKATRIYTGWRFQPLWKILVNWDDYSKHMGKWKMCQTTNQYISMYAWKHVHFLYPSKIEALFQTSGWLPGGW